MAEIAILQANLRNFDTNLKEPVDQTLPEGIDEIRYHRWTDENFPPIADLPGRFQYRIPKLFGWQMLPGYDYYIWLDGLCTFLRDDCATYYLSQLGDADIAFFAHPNRKSIKEEVDHLETYLNRTKGTKRGQDYVLARYKNGLHKEQYNDILLDKDFVDDALYATTTFIYRDSEKVRDLMRMWWLHQSRYYTCDQVVLPYLLWKYGLDVVEFDQPIYKSGYMSLVSHHD